MKKEKGNLLFHKLDKWLGIPIVFILGLLTKKRKRPTQIKKIGILNIGSIGDNVLMSAAVVDIMEQYPEAETTIFTGSTNTGIVKLFPGELSIIQLPITNPYKSIGLIRQTDEVDIFFDFGPWPRLNAIYSFFIKSKFKVGFKTSGQYRHYVYDLAINHSSVIHEIENHRTLISDFYNGVTHMPNILIKPSEKSRNFIATLGKYCIIHPWAGGLKKEIRQWDNNNWKDLINNLLPYFDKFILTGAPGDVKDSAELKSVLSSEIDNEKIIDVAGVFTIAETVHLINEATCIICVDTGVSHISAALNKPMVCLQGPGKIERWGPYAHNNKTIVVKPNKGVYGYLNYGYEYYNAVGNCMDNIPVKDVYDNVIKILE